MLDWPGAAAHAPQNGGGQHLMTSRTADLTWGNFQSVIQLSVALNAAYAALYSFVDDTLKRETDRASTLLRRLRNAPHTTPELLKQKTATRSILSRVYRAERELQQYNRNFLQPASAVFSLVGVCTLIFSAYHGGTSRISDFWALFTCALLLPFFTAMVVYSGFFIILARVSRASRKLLAAAPTPPRGRTDD
jgi:hypothetical protein